MSNKNYYFLINSLEGGGAERVTINFANNLQKGGKDVYIITLKSTNFYDLPKGIHHIGLSNIKNNLLMFLLMPWYVYKLKKTFKQYNLSDGMSLLEISNFVHILAKKDAVISFRTHINFFIGIIGYLQKIFIKILYPKAGKIIVNSLENKYDLAKYLGVSENKIEVVYNPIDKEKIHKLKKEAVDEYLLKKITGKKIFITIGRLVRQKHHEKIIEALSKISDRNRIYLIVGNGIRKDKLEQQVRDLSLQNNILFLGQQKNIFKYLALANIFLYASEVEGFPNVLLEAREMGLPIITSDFTSGAREVILGEDTKTIGKNLEYPYQGKYGWIIDGEKYKEQFLEIYDKTGN